MMFCKKEKVRREFFEGCNYNSINSLLQLSDVLKDNYRLIAVDDVMHIRSPFPVIVIDLI